MIAGARSEVLWSGEGKGVNFSIALTSESERCASQRVQHHIFEVGQISLFFYYRNHVAFGYKA